MVATQLLAPLPGTFYRPASPEGGAIQGGRRPISAGDTVRLIEVMKSFYPVEAETSGKLVRFLVEDGEAVEAEQAVAELEYFELASATRQLRRSRLAPRRLPPRLEALFTEETARDRRQTQQGQSHYTSPPLSSRTSPSDAAARPSRGGRALHE